MEIEMKPKKLKHEKDNYQEWKTKIAKNHRAGKYDNKYRWLFIGTVVIVVIALLYGLKYIN